MPPSGLVESIWIHEGESPGHRFERRLPTPELQLIVSLTSQAAYVVGPATRPVILDTAEQRSVLGAVFRTGAAPTVFGVPAAELRDLHVPLVDLWGARADELVERLLLARGATARRRIAGRMLSTARWPVHPAVTHAVREIVSAPERLSVAALSAQLGLSVRRLEQIFKSDVGLSPKGYMRLQRFRAALGRIDQAPSTGWPGFALESGYYDQSDLIHDFRHYTGLTPPGYLAARGPFVNHVPLPG
jgi:AraC-like DNA-binding protein